MVLYVVYLYKQNKSTMKTKLQDKQEMELYIEGMKDSFLESINEHPSDEHPPRVFTMLLEDNEGDYCVGGMSLKGNEMDEIVIPMVIKKVQEDEKRIVCCMEMVFDKEKGKSIFYFRGELGEDCEKVEETYEFEIRETYSVGDNGDLVREVEVNEV